MEKDMNKIPIIYSKKYNISVLGIENFHSFDTQKYKKIYKYLKKQLNLTKKQFYSPDRITEEKLLLVHSKEYLESLTRSSIVSEIAEIPIIKFVPNIILQQGILKPMRYATAGTIMGTELALKFGWAINLSGGYHHAKRDHGEGFCVYADIPIAIESLWRKNPELKILIIDLDAHQGNGCSAILGKDKRVAILDIFNQLAFPRDRFAENFVSYKVLVKGRIRDKLYLEKLDYWIPKAINEHKPDLIIYNAGSDIYIGDPLGSLYVSEEGILARDEMVFKAAKYNNTPILMLLSGGYHKRSWSIVGNSIVNMIKKGILSY